MLPPNFRVGITKEKERAVRRRPFCKHGGNFCPESLRQIFQKPAVGFSRVRFRDGMEWTEAASAVSCRAQDNGAWECTYIQAASRWQLIDGFGKLATGDIASLE